MSGTPRLTDRNGNEYRWSVLVSFPNDGHWSDPASPYWRDWTALTPETREACEAKVREMATNPAWRECLPIGTTLCAANHSGYVGLELVIEA